MHAMRCIFGEHEFQVVGRGHEDGVTTSERQAEKICVLSVFVIAFRCDLHPTEDVRERGLIANNKMELAELGEGGNVALTEIRQEFSKNSVVKSMSFQIVRRGFRKRCSAIKLNRLLQYCRKLWILQALHAHAQI